MKKYLSDKELDGLVNAIHEAEQMSTGEIRIHIDSHKNRIKERAFKVFKKLKMDKTKHKNAVLLYINFDERYLTIIGDEGIHNKVKSLFWSELHSQMIDDFSRGDYYQSIKKAILKIGIELKKYFPIEGDNPNELPDEITFS